MKRWVVYAAVLASLLLLPKGHGKDVSTLAPVEVFYIYIEDGMLTVETDTGDLGKGISLDRAVRDMKDSADHQVFLETVSYVLVTEETKALLPDLNDYFRPGTEPVLVTSKVELKNMASFLDHHDPQLRLCDCVVEQKVLPKLMTAGERLYLVQ